jgi:hypothetical protein
MCHASLVVNATTDGIEPTPGMMHLSVVTLRRVASSTSDDEGRSLGAVNEPQTLRSLVRQALDARGASGRQLATFAQGHGFRVTATTINHIAAGTYKSEPKPETIRAIAWLAGVTEEVAFAAAGVPMPGPPFADELPPGVDNLSPRSRRAAVEVLRALVEAEQEAGGEHDQRSAPKNQAGDPPATEARERRTPGGPIQTGHVRRPGESIDEAVDRVTSRRALEQQALKGMLGDDPAPDSEDYVLAARDADDDAEAEAQQGEA